MVAVANLQNIRILRFLLVLIAVILIILIYDAYSMTSPTRMQLIDSHQHLQARPKNTNEFLPLVGKLAKPERTDAAHRESMAEQRLPTINEYELHDWDGTDASADVAAEIEIENLLNEQQQYMQSLDNLLDKNVQLSEPLSPAEELSNNLLDADGEDNAVPKVDISGKHTAAMPELPPPAISMKPKLPLMLVVPHPSAPRSTPDPLKGIATEKLYESGHMDKEIDAERICPHHGTFTKLLILVTSAQSHAEARMSIRQTWGHYGTRRDVSMAFILGRTTNETMNKMLTQENYIYGDLIRGNFIDSYNNLTLKTLSLLEWIDLNCSYAKYILKTDDDMFINVAKLLSFLDRYNDRRVIYGRVVNGQTPIRNMKSKYYISPDQFAASVFPAFSTGPAYVLSGDIVHEIFVRSLSTVYLKLEDVFTTGIVAQKLGIKRVHVNSFVNRYLLFHACNIRNAISVHMIKPNEQFELWEKLLDQRIKCQ